MRNRATILTTAIAAAPPLLAAWWALGPLPDRPLPTPVQFATSAGTRTDGTADDRGRQRHVAALDTDAFLVPLWVMDPAELAAAEAKRAAAEAPPSTSAAALPLQLLAIVQEAPPRPGGTWFAAPQASSKAGARAVFYDPARDRIVTVAEGERVGDPGSGGFEVRRIGPRDVTLGGGSGVTTFFLSPPPPPPPPSPSSRLAPTLPITPTPTASSSSTRRFVSPFSLVQFAPLLPFLPLEPLGPDDPPTQAAHADDGAGTADSDGSGGGS